MALLHGTGVVCKWQKGLLWRIPSEETTQGQGRQCRQQEVGDSVEMQWTEGHHGDGQWQRETGGQREEFTGRGEEDVD